MVAWELFRNIENDDLREFLISSSTETELRGSWVSLSKRTKNVLIKLGVKSIEDIRSLKKETLAKARNCGKKTISEVVAFQMKFRDEAEDSEASPATATCDGISHSECVFQQIIGKLSVRSNNIIRNFGVNTLEEFMRLDERSLLLCRNCGRKSASEIMRLQKEAVEVYSVSLSPLYAQEQNPEELSPVPETEEISDTSEHVNLCDIENPSRWLIEWIDSLVKSKKKARAFMLRKGMLGFPPMTLEQVAQDLGGLTRERIRQMENFVESKISAKREQRKLFSLASEAARLVRREGGICHLMDLTTALLCRGENATQLTHATKLIQFFLTLEVWKNNNLIVRDGVVYDKNSIHLISKLAGVLDMVASASADEWYDQETWSISSKSLKRALLESPLVTFEADRLDSVSSLLLETLAKRCKRKIRIHKGRFYSEKLWRLRFGKAIETVEIVLKNMGGPAHFSEVAKEVQKWRTNLSARHVHAKLDSSDNALLWDRGTFVHMTNVVIPFGLIRDIEDWILAALKEDVPFISVYGAYVAFRSNCMKNGLLSEIALYTCLRHSDHPEIEYPRLPWVYRRNDFVERIPIPLALDQFFRDAGGPISQDEAQEYAYERLFLKDYQYNQMIQKVSNVIRTKDWGYLHLDNAQVNGKDLQPLVDHALGILEKEKHLSVDRVYRDKKLTCRVLDIDSPVMLYGLFQHFADEVFSLERYPIIARSTDKGERSITNSVKKVIRDYIRDFDRPCPLTVLEEHFIRTLGYKESHVYSITSDRSLCPYHVGCLVHLDTIGWDETIQEQLEQAAYDYYKNAVKAGECFGRISSLIESSSLPSLQSNLPWSHTLLSELLARGGRFVVLGNAREIFLPKNNEQGINNLETLVGKILKRDWGGAANLITFENTLVREGIIKKHLTPRMLEKGQTVEIRNGEIMLKELVPYVKGFRSQSCL